METNPNNQPSQPAPGAGQPPQQPAEVQVPPGGSATVTNEPPKTETTVESPGVNINPTKPA